MAQFPWLSLLILLPLAGGLLCLCAKTVTMVRTTALTTLLLALLVSLFVLYLFEPGSQEPFQLMEQYTWIPGLNVHFLIGVDGISVLFLPATAVLTVMTILASWHSIDQQAGLYYAMMLFLFGITMGIFLALDTILFFLFWELSLPPIYFLISLWGVGPQRRQAAMKYTMYMMFGGIPLLFGFILLAMHSGGGANADSLVFSIPTLLASSLAPELQPLLFLLLVLGFAAKAPLFPFHTWLPTVAMESPVQLTALLVGLKLGAYGILRFALPLAPEAAVDYGWLLGILGGLTLVYAALIAIQQSNLRRMLAYASISHVGLVIIGIASLNTQGIQGAIFQLLNFSMIAAALMLICGFLYQRGGSTELTNLGGLGKSMPRLASVFFILALASIGLPGTSGFAAELLLIIGAFKLHAGLGMAALVVMVLGAAYLLTHTRKTFWGPPQPNTIPHTDLKTRELLILVTPCLVILVFGMMPGLILDLIAPATESWLQLFR